MNALTTAVQNDTARSWTVSQVKDLLPAVDVRLPNGRLVLGKLRGRRNPFATVYVGSMEDTQSAEFSWDTIVHCLNNNRPLRF